MENENNNGKGTSSAVSLSIQQEIHRFESVHPAIYSIYELIENLSDPALASLIRDQVVNIEDSFVNSQEWTLSRSVDSIHIGLLGSVASAKSTLVHRYLTGQYVPDHSPEGGRFKKELLLGNSGSMRPYLLLIRDEGGPPEQQFSHWVDVVMLVASGDFETVSTCFSYTSRLTSYRDLKETPIVLVADSSLDASSMTEFKKIPHNLFLTVNVKSGENVEKAFYETCCLAVGKSTGNFIGLGNSNHNNNIVNAHLRKFTTGGSRRKSAFVVSTKKHLAAAAAMGQDMANAIKQATLQKKSYKLKKWKKKLVLLTDSKLIYHDSADKKSSQGKVVDLGQAAVKIAGERGFEVKNLCKSFEFECSNREEALEWVAAIQQQILVSIGRGDHGISGLEGRLQPCDTSLALKEEVLTLEGNDCCADCGDRAGEWISVNLGVVICIGCSGVHRQLGSHVSKVRSLSLDVVSPWLLKLLQLMGGNRRANEMLWEKGLPIASLKPPPSSSREDKSRYIRQKYEKMEFLLASPYKAAHLPELYRSREFYAYFLTLLRTDKRQLLLVAEQLCTDICAGKDLQTEDFEAAAYLQLFLWATDDSTKGSLKHMDSRIVDVGCRMLVDNL